VRTLGLACLLGLTLVTQGCAVFVRGDQQDVRLETKVPGVQLWADGNPVKPGPVTLDRGRIHVFQAEAPGYDPMEITVYPVVDDDWLFAEQCTMWPILWLPMAVDLNTGALNNLPASIDMTQRKSDAAPPADVIADPDKKILRQRKSAFERMSVRDFSTSVMPVPAGSDIIIDRDGEILRQRKPPEGYGLDDYRTSRMDLRDGY
jgi:hypothetical protein